ncbi:MAG: DUF58 domain-containing protein [Anaerolineales bacterium]|nr:DUF58 domain-containing protein [Anaerolineales bacterium]
MSPDATIRLRVGWPLLLLPALVFGQLVTPHSVWVVLLVVLIGLYGSAFAWVRAQAGALTFSRRRQDSLLVAGDILHEDFELQNHGRLPVIWAEFIDGSDLPHYEAGAVIATGPGGVYRWWKEVECSLRGVFRLGPHRLKLGEPIGLFETEIRFERYETLLIYPRVVQLPAFDLARGAAGGSAPRRRPLLGVLPAASVREYSYGDSMRHIHWPTSAHRGELMVKEFEREPSGDVWIALDLGVAAQRGDGRTGTLETSIILAASIAAELVSGRERRAVGLLVASGDGVIALPPQPGQAQLWAVLAALAPAQPSDWSLAELLRRNRSVLGRRHTLILITADTGERSVARDGWMAQLLQLNRQGIGGTVLLVTRPEEAEAAATTVQALDRIDIPARIMRTDMPMRAALTYRRKRRVIRSTPTGGAYTVEVEEEVG